MPPVRTWYTTSEVATLFHVTTHTVQRWADTGRLPYARTLGGHRRFDRRTVEQLREPAVTRR